MKEGQANFELMIELEELEAAKEEAMKEAKEISQIIETNHMTKILQLRKICLLMKQSLKMTLAIRVTTSLRKKVLSFSKRKNLKMKNLLMKIPAKSDDSKDIKKIQPLRPGGF